MLSIINEEQFLSFLLAFWKPLLFLLCLIAGFLVLRLIKKHKFNFNEMVGLVWVSVATSLTLAYAIGAILSCFNKAALLGFNSSDFNVILWPAAITLVAFAIDRFIKYLNDRNGKS